MTKLAPEWVRTSDPVIRSPVRYRWTTAPAHTMQGYWFTPRNCFAWKPELCQVGPLFKDSTFECERGLITGHTPDRSRCKLERSQTTQTQAIDIGAGQYVLITLHDEYLLACKGHNQVRGTLTMGTHYVNLNNDCTLTGERWLLRGQIHQFINMINVTANMTL